MCMCVLFLSSSGSYVGIYLSLSVYLSEGDVGGSLAIMK